MDGEVGIQRDFAPFKGHRAHLGKSWGGSPSHEADSLLLCRPGPSPVTRVPITHSLEGGGRGVFSTFLEVFRTHPDRQGKPSAGWGLLAETGPVPKLWV